MGAWGVKSNETDNAEEYLVSLWANYPFRADVERALHLDVGEHHETVRIAALILVRMSDLLVWEHDDFVKLIGIALTQVAKIAAMEIYCDEDFQEVLAQEILELQTILKKVE